MQENLNTLVDVTIHYPNGIPSYWDFVCGRVKKIEVDVKVQSIQDLRTDGIIATDYFNNEQERVVFQDWLNTQWQAKDSLIEQLKSDKN